MSQAPSDEDEREERGAPLSARLRGGLPIARWLAEYRPGWARADAVAGVTLAAYAIPVSLAYATIAGLPPERGLYGYLFAAPVRHLPPARAGPDLGDLARDRNGDRRAGGGRP